MSLKIKLVNSSAQADVLVVFVVEDALDSQLKNLSVSVENLDQIIEDKKFKGAKASTLCVRLSGQNCKYLVLAGLGKAKSSKVNFENFRRAVAKAVRTAECCSAKSIAMQMPDAALFDVSEAYLIEHAATAAQMANHKFDTFLSDDDKKELNAQLELIVVGGISEIQPALDKSVAMADAVNTAREWVDLPSNHLSPDDLSQKMLAIAKDCGLKSTVFTEPEIKKMGFGGLHAVSKGSTEDCRFVVLEYDCGDKNAPTIALVGKGIMYDTGGISLKPSQYMETMKEDMSGAAAVVNAMKVISKLKPKVNVVSCTPLAENMPSGNAGRPGDIVTFYNGKTAEVKNTDAEGRLVLADALAYAVKHFKPAAIVDIATLTGACEYALGNFFSAMVSEHDELAQQVDKAGKVSGDYVWRLPLTDDYKPAMKSNIADLSNIASSGYKAGTISGAVFLQNFVGETPWVHLDIANTAYNLPMLPYYRADSATGAGVRLLVEFVLNYS
jgi:leucyl aminopeptidase